MAEPVPEYMHSPEIRSLENAAKSCEENGQYLRASLLYQQICDIIVNTYHDMEKADQYRKKARECQHAK
ncbi:MAG: hypothetical protein GOV02_00545 [Candidatus Aenigmarchaeota archaeon]|nr:hypothetical protein [Candidatus Aenigmarchaeota archaeon]